MSELSVLQRIKLRLGVLYDDPLKNTELTERIDACKEDMTGAGVLAEKLETPLAVDTIERYILGGQNDPIYISNVIKLRG
nr:hypothetical protein [uncultured Aminipila sp.]